MSRTLGDDFDGDDLPGGSLDLETGSHVGGGGAGGGAGGAGGTSYDGGGVDFDEDPFSDNPVGGAALELDLPAGDPASTRSRAVPPAPPPAPAHQAPQAPHLPHGGGPQVPDLALGPSPSRSAMPAVRPSSSMPAVRPSASMPAVRPSASMPAVRPSGSHAAQAAPPPSANAPSEAHAPGGGDDPGAPELAAPPPRANPGALIAKYPNPPEKVWQTPMYALRVGMRLLELRSNLESLRKRRSPDVPLYEAALLAYDVKAFRVGVAIDCAVFALATFVFFLPVILRFMRAD